ncbi:MAG: hypothetical protein K6B17_03475 [Treponema sp.]|nr:hypothetical protein [Treponema sp.]
MLMVFFSEIFILLVKCSYVFMSEKKTEFNAALSEDVFVKACDIICIKYNFLKFAASNEKFGRFFSDKATIEYKNITGLS